MYRTWHTNYTYSVSELVGYLQIVAVIPSEIVLTRFSCIRLLFVIECLSCSVNFKLYMTLITVDWQGVGWLT